MKIHFALATASILLGLIVVVSVLVGKTPYLGFFQRNFIARRKWDSGYFWSMIAQYAVVSVVFGVAALLVP